MEKKNMRTFPLMLSVFFALFGIGALLTFSAGTAHAQVRSSPRLITTVQMRGMYTGKKQGIIPLGETTLDCGTIAFYVNDLGNGNALFWEKVSSTRGSIITLSYSVSWTNWSGGNGSLGRPFVFPTNPWLWDDKVHTNSGYVTASIQASDFTSQGWSCSGTQSDGDWIN